MARKAFLALTRLRFNHFRTNDEESSENDIEVVDAPTEEAEDAQLGTS